MGLVSQGKITSAESYFITGRAYVTGAHATRVPAEYPKSTRGKSKQAIGADWFADELADLVGVDDD